MHLTKILKIILKASTSWLKNSCIQLLYISQDFPGSFLGSFLGSFVCATWGVSWSKINASKT